MSKVVRKIGKAVGRVVKGAAKVVRKVASSDAFKIIGGAALAYFGGAALMGGLGATGAGGAGFIKGAVAGLGNAANGVTGAWNAITSGSGFKAAGSSLAQGLTGAKAAGSAASATGTLKSVAAAGYNGTGLLKAPTVGKLSASVPTAPPGVGTGTTFGGMGKPVTMSDQVANILASAPGNAASTVVTEGSKQASGNLLTTLLKNPVTPYAAMQLVGGAMQGKALQDQEEEYFDRVNRNLNFDYRAARDARYAN